MIQNQPNFAESEIRQIEVRLRKTLGDIQGCRKHYLLEAVPGMMPVVEQVIQSFLQETRGSVEFAHAQDELQLVDYDPHELTRLIQQYESQPAMQIALNVAFEDWKQSPGAEERLRQIVDYADHILSSGSETVPSAQAPS